MMTKKEIFKKVGLFDEDYFAYAEDMDWGVRAKKKNIKVAVLPDSKVYHKHSRSTKGSYFKVYLIARNSIFFAKKNLGSIKKIAFIGSSIILGIVVNLMKYKNPFFVKDYLKGVYDGLFKKIKLS